MAGYDIIAYVYDAGIHCVPCTVRHFGIGIDKSKGELDENGVPYDTEDREGNAIGAVFQSDSRPEDITCDQCLTPIQ